MSINNLKSGLVSVADAIRSKTGSSATLKIEDMPGAIQSIETGTAEIQWPPDDPNEEYSWYLIEVDEGQEVTLPLCVDGDGSVDYGDGNILNVSVDDGSNQTFTHTYAKHGEYLIKMDSNLYFDHLFNVTLSNTSSLNYGNAKKDNFILKRAIIAKYNTMAAMSSHFNLKSVTYKGFLNGGMGFKDCYSLEKAIISKAFDSVTANCSDFFCDCYFLEEVELNDYTSYLPRNFFSGCAHLKNINLPSNLKNIDKYAFHNCTSIKSIEIPDGVTKLGSSAFASCTSLEEFECPESVTSISSYVFESCTNLKSFSCSDTVSSIEAYAFSGCTSLEKFIFPTSTTTIKSSSFNRCTGLRHFVILNDSAVVSLANANAFSGTTCNFYVPDDLVESYRVATNWTTYAYRILHLSDCPSDVYSVESE